MSETTENSLKNHLSWTIWHTQVNGTLRGVYHTGRRGVVFTENDLAALHPDLPQAARAQRSWIDRVAPGTPLYGDFIANQWRYLTEPLLLPLLRSDPLSEDWSVAVELWDLRRAMKPESMRLTALACGVETVNGICIVLPFAATAREYELPFAWLDEHVPGWSPRFEAAEFLGLAANSRATHVLTPSAISVLPEASIEGVAFD